MFRKIGLPALAILGILMGIFLVGIGAQKKPVPRVEFPPPHSPYKHYVAGEGMVEASSENIDIGTDVSGVVVEVFVKVGDFVKKDDPLFRIDSRSQEARLDVAIAAQEVVREKFVRLISLPRPEDVPPMEAIVGQAEVEMNDQKTQLSLYESLSDPTAVSVNELNQRRFAAQSAQYRLLEAQGNLALLKAGAWIRDLEITSAELERAVAEVNQAEVEIERATVRAPCDGQVFQVRVRPGQYMSGGTTSGERSMLFGKIDPLHLRIDIDEEDAWRVRPCTPATAFVRGNGTIKIPLEYVRTEPYIIPKRSLTGSNMERVDTRVLQVIYRFDKGENPVYLGQLMDVFIEAVPLFPDEN